MPEQDKIRTSWPHQLLAIAFILKCFAIGRRGVMLAMEPGTGKTRVAIEIIRALFGMFVEKAAGMFILIICPLRVAQVWQDQLAQHAQFPFVLRILDERSGSVADKARIARETITFARATKQICILVINYESVWLEPFANFALNTRWHLIIGDEIHRIKQASGKCSRFMGKLARRALYRLGLTGTPIPHTWLDIWAQYRFLDASVFDPTYTSFKLYYGIWGGFQGRELKGQRNEQEFQQRLSSIAFRVSKDVLCLPPEMDQELYADLSPKGRRHYDELDNLFLTWLGETPDELLTTQNALERLLRLQQLTGGTLKDDQNVKHQVDTSKEDLLADWLIDQPNDEPIVAFARFISDLDAIGRAATRAGVTYSEVSGRSPQGIAEWQAGKTQLLVAQIQVAGEGQDFTRARYCVFYSLGFSLYQYVQARARVHRAGQTRPTTYFHLLCKNTVDERVLHAIRNRWEIVETILKEIKNDATRPIPRPILR